MQMFSPSNGFSAIRPCKASALYGSQREASTSRKITERKELMMGCRRPLTGLFKLLKKTKKKKISWLKFSSFSLRLPDYTSICVFNMNIKSRTCCNGKPHLKEKKMNHTRKQRTGYFRRTCSMTFVIVEHWDSLSRYTRIVVREMKQKRNFGLLLHFF